MMESSVHPRLGPLSTHHSPFVFWSGQFHLFVLLLGEVWKVPLISFHWTPGASTTPRLIHTAFSAGKLLQTRSAQCDHFTLKEAINNLSLSVLESLPILPSYLSSAILHQPLILSQASLT